MAIRQKVPKESSSAARPVGFCWTGSKRIQKACSESSSPFLLGFVEGFFQFAILTQ